MKASVKKKTYNLDEKMIDRVRRLFNVKTETEAIQKALQKTIEDQEIEQTLERLLREGSFKTIRGRVNMECNGAIHRARGPESGQV